MPMNRLLQGDVGSGKTAVATMRWAPPSTPGSEPRWRRPARAEQHARNITQIFAARQMVKHPRAPADRQHQRSGTPESTPAGRWVVDVVIGTHALIQEGVEFHDLAVAVIDEQHRFGVEQRGMLRGKGTNPHVLVMTATPIYALSL